MAIVERKNRNGSITYQVKVKDPNGKWYATPGFRDRADALAEEAKLLKLKRKGTLAMSDDAKTVTVAEYWEVWSVENRSDISAGWKISQDQMWRDYVLPVIGDLKMRDVGAPDIGQVLNRAAKKGIGPQTRKHIYSLMRKMFGDAVGYYEMLAKSPVNPKFHRPKVSEVKRKFLMPQEAFRLLDHVKDHYLGPAIWLQVLSGMRESEAFALRWKSVFFDQDMILIAAAYNSKERRLQDHPKQEDWAYVPMIPMLREYLEGREGEPEAFVVPSSKGQMLSPNTFYHGLKRVCKAAGVPVVSPHELRHTASEIWVQAGATAEDIRRLLNHKSLSATKHYIHRTDDRLSSIGKQVGRSFPNSFPNGKKEADRLSDEGIGLVH